MTTQTATEFAGVTITLREESAADFVQNIADLSETNVQASYGAYLAALCAAVASEYPGATVETSRHDAYADSVSADRSVVGADEIEDRVYSELFREMRLHELAEAIYERADFWVAVEPLRENGVYTFRTDVETITVVATPGDPDGYVLYTIDEWLNDSLADWTIDGQGYLAFQGDRWDAAGLRIEDLEETGLGAHGIGFLLPCDGATYEIWCTNDPLRDPDGDIEAGQWLYQPEGWQGGVFSPGFATMAEAAAAAQAYDDEESAREVAE